MNWNKNEIVTGSKSEIGNKERPKEIHNRTRNKDRSNQQIYFFEGGSGILVSKGGVRNCEEKGIVNWKGTDKEL